MIAVRRLALSVALILFGQDAFAADYYVKNGGNDGLDGLSVPNAWATLQHAADVVNSGDTVHVLNGSYQGFDLQRSGSAGSPITFVAESPAVSITTDNQRTPDGINVENAAYVVIDGFTVDHRTRAGIRTAVSQFVTVRNCRTGFNGRWGIFSGFADDFIIEDNDAHDSMMEHGIYVSNSGDRPIIRGNLVHDNHANGIHMNGDESQGGDGTISNALVERNVIHGNGVGGGSGINMDGVSDSVIRNNLLYDNHASGISLYQIDAATGARNNLVINNTIITAADGRWCVNINSGSTGNTIRNNILYNYHSFHGAITIDSSSQSGFTSDDNSLMDRFSTDSGDTIISLAAWQGLGYDTHSFLATPTDNFVNPGVDFHLVNTSPARDTGTATNAPNRDLDDNPRPVGSGFDIGAYELQLLSCHDGQVDPGEQCGEPGLPACADACTSCIQCVCSPNTPVCGDGLICGNEACEVDGDCGSGQVCDSCQCRNALACTSGIGIDRPSQRIIASPYALRVKGQAVIPKPWMAVDPIAHGMRVVIDASSGSERIDFTIPAGAFNGTAGWKLNRAGTTWTYIDRAGSIAGVQAAKLKDRSRTADGLVQWSVKAKGGTAQLPNVAAVRTAVVVGTAQECAAIAWGGPADVRPHCTGDVTAMSCR